LRTKRSSVQGKVPRARFFFSFFFLPGESFPVWCLFGCYVLTSFSTLRKSRPFFPGIRPRSPVGGWPYQALVPPPKKQGFYHGFLPCTASPFPGTVFFPRATMSPLCYGRKALLPPLALNSSLILVWGLKNQPPLFRLPPEFSFWNRSRGRFQIPWSSLFNPPPLPLKLGRPIRGGEVAPPPGWETISFQRGGGKIQKKVSFFPFFSATPFFPLEVKGPH